MTPTDSAIARRLRVQCERFGWGEGSSFWVQEYSAPRDEWPGGWGEPWPERVDGDMTRHESKYRTNEDTDGDRRIVGPDPHDPATVGCFAAMARKARGLPELHTRVALEFSGAVSSVAGWTIDDPCGRMCVYERTEIEAWLAVLEATP